MTDKDLSDVEFVKVNVWLDIISRLDSLDQRISLLEQSFNQWKQIVKAYRK